MARAKALYRKSRGKDSQPASKAVVCSCLEETREEDWRQQGLLFFPDQSLILSLPKCSDEARSAQP